MVTTRSLYGFSPQLEPFVGKRPDEQVDLLQSWGNTAIFGGYRDPAFVDAAHEAGMPVYAEFGCFVGQRWWQTVPTSRPITADGSPLENDGGYYGVNPTVPEVRQTQLKALESLLAAHALDGVWLDFIRWPCHWESPDPYRPPTSFDRPTLDRFVQDTGIKIPRFAPTRAAQALLGPYRAEWSAWRCRQITSWVARAKQVRDRVRPNALLGLFGVPWRRNDYDGAIIEIIGQDYRALGAQIDVFSPMVYHRMCGQPPRWIADVVHEVHTLSGKPVWPIVQSIPEPSPLTVAEYRQALDVAQHSPDAQGVLVFELKSTLLLGDDALGF